MSALYNKLGFFLSKSRQFFSPWNYLSKKLKHKKKIFRIFRFLIENPQEIARAEELCERPEFCITLYLDSQNIKVQHLNSDSDIFWGFVVFFFRASKKVIFLCGLFLRLPLARIGHEWGKIDFILEKNIRMYVFIWSKQSLKQIEKPRSLNIRVNPFLNYHLI